MPLQTYHSRAKSLKHLALSSELRRESPLSAEDGETLDAVEQETIAAIHAIPEGYPLPDCIADPRHVNLFELQIALAKLLCECNPSGMRGWLRLPEQTLCELITKTKATGSPHWNAEYIKLADEEADRRDVERVRRWNARWPQFQLPEVCAD